MELDTIINTRRSIRKYKNQPIEVEKVEMIIKAAVEAESWKNSQTARYHIITSKELLIEFKKHVYQNLIKKIVRMHQF